MERVVEVMVSILQTMCEQPRVVGVFCIDDLYHSESHPEKPHPLQCCMCKWLLRIIRRYLTVLFDREVQMSVSYGDSSAIYLVTGLTQQLDNLKQ